MTFVQKSWQNNPPSSNTPLTAEELNRIEGGISQAISSKGYLPNNADMNTYVQASQSGTYYLDGNRTFQNFPGATSSPPQGAIFIVTVPTDNGHLGGLQEVVWGDKRYWREAQNRSSQTWYDWHEIPTDGSIWSKGFVPNFADLNTYTSASDSGAHYIVSNRTFTNFPGDRNSPDQGAVMIVSMPVDNAVNGGLQEVIWGANRWWREVRNRESQTWYEWHRIASADELPDLNDSEVVQSATVKRIVTSANPDLPLEDGDLLIVWEG